ncbi:MAG: hypothetical protein HRU18_01465 [Pseudoalteromonas sp.]|uniref:hypothetical protein n=1 Tax=Pseudoalteromonas sp. TaxID=53249 RepID=UPI001DA2FB6B|nr:hypothetical protein [Pseudoalteromonas sp.]NRA76849.1 hypothetical protein [Pseudoalteromonas sp.]
MKICEKIKLELGESITSQSGLGVAVKNFGNRVQQLLNTHNLKVINYNIEKVCDSLADGKPPKGKKVRIPMVRIDLHKHEGLNEKKELKLKGDDLFKDNDDVPRAFKNHFADSFNAYASIIINADDSLFSNKIGRKDYLKHFLQIKVISAK